MKKIFSGGKAQLAVLAAFFINGAILASWVSRLPAIQNKLGLSEGALGLVLLGSSAGVITALLLAGGLIEKYGSRKITLVSALILCGFLPLLSLAPNAISLFCLLFFFGGSMSIMDVAMNEQAVLVQREAGRPIISLFHGGFSIGGLTGALISAGITAIPEISLQVHFSIVAMIFIVTAMLIFPHFVRTDTVRHEKRSAFHIPERALWLLGILAFCCMLTEGAMSDWSAIYLTRVLQTNSSQAALAYAAFSMMMTAGRLTGDAVTTQLGAGKVVRFGSLVAILGLITIILTDQPVVAIIGFGAVGIGVANIVPLIYSAAGNTRDISPGTGIAGVATIGYLASLVGPPMIGAIADKSSLRVSFLVLLIFIAPLVFAGKAVADHAGYQKSSH
ncbi:MAG: MFS transporter [Chloroflexi bacterium]|nr:MFS transporter [Chloroflexota bacterium]